ncbi:N-lysine methyltransferase KMT5A isoform X1 [Tiliqua scincoides]|uniref:N-lysine methyltransferase KMT5A isoform X1 n=1 Tax=Tiliqua scincoides TaxID=71010 RepID=UPI003462F72A
MNGAGGGGLALSAALPRRRQEEDVPSHPGGRRRRAGEQRPAQDERGEHIYLSIQNLYLHESQQISGGSASASRGELRHTSRDKVPGQTGERKLQKGRGINISSATEGAVKSEDQNDKEGRDESPESSSNQKPEAPETGKLLSPVSAKAATTKQAPKKGTKTKSGPKRKAQVKTQPNRKVTDYFPVRRSSRKSKKELQIEEKKRLDGLIENGKEEGMKIDFIDGKGRGVIATKHFSRGEFVVEYHGDLIEITDAKKREALYAQDPSTGCYMYYFQYLSKTYCVDATKETNRLGRLVNHSKCGNCQTKLHDVNGIPHLILVASRDIKAGEELLYDYGDRSKASLEAHPWLKH